MVLVADVAGRIGSFAASDWRNVILHSAFDLLAVVTAAAVFYFLPLPQSSVAQSWRLHPAYVSFASLGMITGALVAGTGNLLLSGFGEIGKSVLGGLAGAILAIEILKHQLGITGSTGLRFAAPLAAAIAVGRLGCFFAGIEDRTYGTPTDLPWGRDFGDGVCDYRSIQLVSSDLPGAPGLRLELRQGGAAPCLENLAPTSFSARRPRCARAAFGWSRRRSSNRTVLSGTRSAARITAYRRRWYRATLAIGSAAATF
jgi:hypothetical protein